MPTTAPYGTWESPITPEDLVAGSINLSDVWVDDDRQVCWLEGRPTEGGRQVVVREGIDLMPPGFNARTSVHEYGGGAWRIRGHNLFFSNFEDQVVYRVEFGGQTPGPPTPITPDPAHPRGDRYADFEPTKNGRFLICVRERHSGEPGEGPDGMVEAVNELVAIPVLPAGEAGTLTDPQVLAGGHDFYAAPRLSPDGRRLCWMTWDHPNMPWDGAELWVADLALAGAAGLSLRNELLVAGGLSEAPTQARWLPDGSLVFASDRTNWWNLYRWNGLGTGGTALCEKEAEFAGPQWTFGASSYCVLPDGRMAVTWGEEGSTRLGLLDPEHPGELRQVHNPFTALGSLRAVDETHVALVAASPTEFNCVAVVNLHDGSVEVKRRSREAALDGAAISIAEPIEFPTLDGSNTAHALYYAPVNPRFAGPDDERPPLIVKVHGGPTGGVNSTLELAIQFWTTRGFAVVDVNYGGSAGYGRRYRERLNGKWGVVDVEDSYAAAKYLWERGDADLERVEALVPPFDRELLGTLLPRMPALRLIQVLSAGVDWIDGLVPPRVTLCNARGSRDVAVAEWVVAAILHDAQDLGRADA
ncbi:MAG: prolyl oligopeptidase family serine peptidase, partial [Actinobacteria bacterium]|nr:prolyl oligopeptidase family serine peptidase [Actinomycetota bacterium]